MVTPVSRTAFVTGAARGIGLATVQRLLADGYGVVLGDVSAKGLAALDDFAAETGDRLIRATVDVTDSAQVQAAIDQAVERWGRLDVLVNNAGRNRIGDSYDTTPENWDWILDTNLKAVFFCSQAAVRQMRAQGGGAIVNIASTSASGMDGNPAYSASKAGVIGLTYTMAREVGPDGIRVNAVAPGATLSEWVQKNTPPERLQAMAEAAPLRRYAEPADIAAVIAFLASDDARHLTGQILSASGGAWMP